MKLIPKQYAKILYEVTRGLNGKDLDDAIKEYVSFLRHKQMITKVNYIIEEFIKYSKERERIVTLSVKSARKLSDNELKRISKAFGDKVDARSEVDGSLIGGVFLRVGNKIIDGSVKARLAKLKRDMG